MKVVEYIGEVLPNGYLSLPDEVRKELGRHTQVKVTLTVETPSTPDAQTGWQVFRDLGKDAIGGRLSEASTKHDEYLYGTRK